MHNFDFAEPRGVPASRDLPDLADALLVAVPKTMRSIRAEIRRNAAVNQNELSLTQMRVLSLLLEAPLSNSELAAEIGVSLPAMTRQMDAMVKSSWVTRICDTGDRRRNTLTVTPEGKRTYLRIRAEVANKLTEKLEHLSASEKSQLRIGLQVLQKVTASHSPEVTHA